MTKNEIHNLLCEDAGVEYRASESELLAQVEASHNLDEFEAMYDLGLYILHHYDFDADAAMNSRVGALGIDPHTFVSALKAAESCTLVA